MILSIPVVLFGTGIVMVVLDLNVEFWNEWGLYMMHLPLSIGLYFILFAEEKNEDEFYLSLRLRSIARGVMMIMLVMVMLPLLANLSGLIIGGGRELVLPDIGGNMAVCTLLLVYSNFAYFHNKSRMATDD